ncbi:hypothetical protein PF004_g12583 [Phytophthora fragariae]|uniref:Uncharacterized protein n=1 Tax=Phytophthora fragariae TaxID=53985 RepID=A0A6G0NUL6_9STRA|nr:hypothetical protein PF004_g12583 [Phytophthora fragariae]
MMNEPTTEERENTFESACAPYCEPTTEERETTFESACATDCEPATENENPYETSEDVTENLNEASEDVTENPCEASEDANENPYEASEDANEKHYEASEDAKEDPCKGRGNAARLVGLPDVSRGPITKIYEDFGLGRSAKRRTVLEAGANPIEAPDPPLRGEGQIVNETKPALSTLDDDAALAYCERVGSVTEYPSEEEVEDLTPLDPRGPGPPLSKEETSLVANPEYAGLFTQDELDALEAGRPSPAAEEKEEYDNEIEERLFPLDEVELLKEMKKNAAKEKELTLEELSSLLNLPVETLARTRESSPAELSAPEYWSAWYRRTLAASEEAKRANRDFKAPTTAAAGTPRVGAVQPDWSDGLKAEENDLISEEVMNVSVKESNESPPEPVTDERLVAGNICVAFSGSEVENPPQEDPVKTPFRLRSLIRTVVYQIVLEEESRSVLRCPACLNADSSPSDDSSTTERLPELDANVKIARTLCTVHEGKAIVEVCNASTEDLVLSKGTALAAATVVPKSAFDSLNADQESSTSESNPTPCGSGGRTTWVDSVISAAAAATTPSLEPMPGLDAAKEAELDVDFTDSKLVPTFLRIWYD